MKKRLLLIVILVLSFFTMGVNLTFPAEIKTIGGVMYGSAWPWLTASTVVCVDSNKLPVSCSNISDIPYLPKTGGSLSGALNEAKGADIASATTTDIGAATGNYVEVTGAVTIVGFGTVQAGTRRIVRYTSNPAPLITYNATSNILPGSRDIQAEQNDRHELVSLGSGNWVTVAFLKANGRVLGDLIIVTQGATADVAAKDMRGQTHLVTGAYTLSLPTAAIGYSACFIATTAAVFSLDVKTGTDIITLNGTNLAAGNKISSDASINAEICVKSTAAGFYRATSKLGLFQDGGA